MHAILLATLYIASTAAQAVKAPEFVGNKWLNTPDGKPVTLASRAGKVTLVHFWAFACSNCHANMPAYQRLLTKFKDRGVEMIGIHTPEIDQEKKDENLLAAVKKWAVKYPMLIDSDGQNWNNWKQDVWPTLYVIDQEGSVAYYWVGELAYKGARGEQEVANVVERLLKNK